MALAVAEVDVDEIVRRVEDGEVEVAVVVEVAAGNVSGREAQWLGGGIEVTAAAQAGEELQVIAAGVDGDDAGLAVVQEFADRQAGGLLEGLDLGRHGGRGRIAKRSRSGAELVDRSLRRTGRCRC